nr:hypothetical protein GCM10020092_058890 [Actinoplanes digitatis]
MSNLTRHRLFWPAAVLVLLLASNVFFAPRFFTITLQDGHLYGSLIDILRSATPLALVALGMTMVIATGGIDLSLGSIMAISGALACLIIGDLPNQNSVGGVLIAVGVALVLSALLGVWNGVLVSVIGIQPIIATLILMVAQPRHRPADHRRADHQRHLGAVPGDRRQLPPRHPGLGDHRRGRGGGRDAAGTPLGARRADRVRRREPDREPARRHPRARADDHGVRLRRVLRRHRGPDLQLQRGQRRQQRG